jgi:hypothetical protein
MGTVFVDEAQARKALGDLYPEKKKKKAGTGATAMKHARAVVADAYPLLPVLEAQQKVFWIPDHRGPCRSCGRNLTPRSSREDLFGCFDLMVLGIPSLLIQVTTQTKRGETVAARKRKIREGFVTTYLPVYRELGQAPATVEIWSWVARTEFLRWYWSWTAGEWRKDTPLPSPLIKSR